MPDEFNLDIPRMGNFILFRHEKGWLGDLIYKTQKGHGFSDADSMYTHIGVSGGGQYMVDVKPPKTIVTDILIEHKGRYVKIIEFIDPGYVIKRYKIAFWAATLSNLAYDWWGVLKFRIGFLWHQKNQFFCSENACWALRKEFSWALREVEAHKCMPAHFLNKEFFRVTWEGYLFNAP